ncbi:MAG: hypothetical protein IPK82_03770 [Polyangiaceae bacterium]|nr:hypothetical protein [Polyangiaceae bacterium]
MGWKMNGISVGLAVRLALLGAILGPLLDRMHAWTGAIGYHTPLMPWGVPWWVSIVYAGAALGIGLTHPVLDKWLGKQQRVPITGWRVGAAFLLLVLLWAASGLLPLGNAAVALFIFVGSAASFWAFDRTWQGAVMAVGTGVGGVIVEATLVRLGLFYHRSPTIWGLPLYLPCLYFAGSVAIGNLARVWRANAARVPFT